MIADFDDTSTQLVVETPSGLPENVRHAMNVLSSLGLKDDAMFLALVNDCITADPLHICRMVRKGLLSNHPEVREDRIVFSGTELHIPFGDDGEEIPNREVVISLDDNAMLSTFYDKEQDLYQYIAGRPLFDFQTLTYLDHAAEDDPDDRVKALYDLINGLQELAHLCYIDQSALEDVDNLLPVIMTHLDDAGTGQ